VPEAAVAADSSFWTIDQLAERCGHYCWLERRLFELTGERASAPTTGEPSASEAEIRLTLSVMSARHAVVAEQWRDRLPVRAGVDRQGLIAPPPGLFPETLDFLGAETDLPGLLGCLVQQILPRLLDSYDEHLGRASEVAEAPVMALLAQLAAGGWREIEQGLAVVRRVAEDPAEARNVAKFTVGLQRRLEGATGVFPSARAS
jgi:hypothetical protein